MCGIAGFISPSVASHDREAAVVRMCQAMRHRGPDGSGVATRHEASIGSCRLAIFDPTNGQQPMVSPDGRWTLVFNGAIYNFKELRAELSSSGWRFATDCDSEVLLASFIHWGERCLSRLRGMYAFAVWDDAERSLFLARDPFGIKPLYYLHTGADFLFASELNALLASGAVSAEIDPSAVADYLAWLAVPAPRTIYRGMLTLQPGEFATFVRGEFKVRPSWSFRGVPESRPCGKYEDFVCELRVRLEDTVRSHMLADVPVGAFLSGGLDSAAAVGLMTRAGGSTLRTFCIGFDDAKFSEAAGAESVARHFGARHHTSVLTGSQVARDIDALLGSLDQPTGDGINTYYASKAAREGGVTVAISGLGGDELFGGYPSFRDTPRFARLLPLWRRLPRDVRMGVVNRLNRGDTRHRKLADVLQHGSGIHELGALQRRVFCETTRTAMLDPEVLGTIPPLRPFHPALGRLSSDLADASPADLVSAWELRTYMADVLLRDSDVMSMRHSLELRVPFVDRPFVEWLWRQPAKFTKRHGKSALFDSVRELMPPEMAGRRKKGFMLPFAIWMKQELRPFLADTFSDASVDRSGLFARANVQKLWTGFLAGNDSREWSRVWSLAVLIAFANRRTEPRLAAETKAAVEVACPAPAQITKRTLLMAPEIFASEGGIPRILQLYLKALCDPAEKNCRVRLLALNDAPEDGVKGRASVNGMLEESQGCRRSKPAFVKNTIRLAKGCDTIVCGHVRQLPVAWLAQKLNPSVRYYLVAHGIEVWRPFTAVERVALRGAERILCVSDYTRRELLKNCPLEDGRAVVLHNALDPFFVIEPGRPLPECEPTILVVTRLTYADRYKGVQHMIEAMPAIRAAIPNAKLRLVGRGDDLSRLRRIRDDLSLKDAVEFTGYIDDQRLRDEMRNCRLFALPSRKEGFGLVFIEAMAHGRPCLGARAGGVPEVINDDSGVLIEYGDVPAIAAAAIDALTRKWDEQKILARADRFAFPAFKNRLKELLNA